MNLRRIGMAAVSYALCVALAECTVGNESFPVHFWYFTATPAWQWSVPVHALGFAWIVIMNLINGGILYRAVLSSWVFFILAETFNLTVLRCFSYAGNVAISLAVILALYLVLCAMTILLLRTGMPRSGT